MDTKFSEKPSPELSALDNLLLADLIEERLGEFCSGLSALQMQILAAVIQGRHGAEVARSFCVDDNCVYRLIAIPFVFAQVTAI